MPPERGRAAKACAACRKQKIRCYEPIHAGASCLRCQRLRLQCSLEELSSADDVRPFSQAGYNSTTNARIDHLERQVARLLERIGEDHNAAFAREERGATAIVDQSVSESRTADGPDDPPVAPVYQIRDILNQEHANERVQTPSTRDDEPGQRNAVEQILSQDDIAHLLGLFAEHYGRWVAFDQKATPQALYHEIRKSPLLLCACCLIAVRHTSVASTIAPRLFETAQSLLSKALLVVPQSIDFFRAVLILSMWSTTVGQKPLSIDSWLISGFAIQHGLSSNLFHLDDHRKASRQMNQVELDQIYLWNHLCLVHLHYCVGTRRPSVLNRVQIDQCKRALSFDSTTNFETRMVAELNLYWILYESLSFSVDLPKSQAALQSWKQDWKHVLEQPRSQFLEMGFYFAQLLVYDRSLKSRSAKVRESLLSEMVRLSSTIIKLAMDTSDERTKHLTDHIYHLITFAAITLCRLLHKYEKDLRSNTEVSDLDTLIVSLVAWLHSIGLPSHAAHILGDTVDAFHKKLRPEARSSSTPANLMDGLDGVFDIGTFFPELIGVDFNNDSMSFLPDWEPLYEGPAT
ncbi:hypothetical protein K402DRAFT_188614 [Aulographum hederae CBS 113979]|uniref:Transcriptional activator of proteases prtT n=1 Tax=Aulographum hederae CBS 113979 TaxID=1176131 RepID=A0A6G1GPF5_9PEZI|nr:hypothetical protein K402DRAFT_188614 [Aulographum hederae CBS 113979]